LWFFYLDVPFEWDSLDEYETKQYGFDAGSGAFVLCLMGTTMRWTRPYTLYGGLSVFSKIQPLAAIAITFSFDAAQ
jgi:hypothetical protein